MMSEPYDPGRFHEILALVTMAMLFLTAGVAFAYIRALGTFLNELKEKEPDVWRRVGTPGLASMFVWSTARARDCRAFLPVLRERAREHGGYAHASRTWRLLKTGLGLTVVVFALAAVLIAWITYHDL
jgi:hypothetical protein